MINVPAGRRRYLNWPEREAMRLKVLEEQAAALRDAGARHDQETSTRDEPERGYPKPRKQRKKK